MFPLLDYARFTTPPRIDVEDAMLSHALKQSHGQPTMSPEDTKLAIISLMCIAKSQQDLIDELIDAVNELRYPKPKFWQRRK